MTTDTFGTEWKSCTVSFGGVFSSGIELLEEGEGNDGNGNEEMKMKGAREGC